jgi:hypothetical protein
MTKKRLSEIITRVSHIPLDDASAQAIADACEAAREGMAAKRREKELKVQLLRLAVSVERAIASFDILLKQQPTPENGKLLSSLISRLEFINDSIRYHCLGVDYHDDIKTKYSFSQLKKLLQPDKL